MVVVWCGGVVWCAAKSPNVSVTHERFNMFTIPPLALLAILSLGFNEVLLHKLLSWCVLVYTLADTMYVVAVPHCMPCGSRFITVVLHHMMVVCIVLHPIFITRTSTLLHIVQLLRSTPSALLLEGCSVGSG